MRALKVLVAFIGIHNVASFGVAGAHGSRNRTGSVPKNSSAPVIYGTKDMSYDDAVKALANHDQVQEVAALIQRKHTQRHSGKHQQHQHQHHRRFTALRAKATQTPSEDEDDTDSAESMLNSLILETVRTLDIEKSGCRDFYISQRQAMQTTHSDLTDASRRAALARAEILRATTAIGNLRQQISQAHGSIKTEREQGEEELDDLNDQLDIVLADIEVMDRVLNLTQCGGQNLDTALLQCKSESEEERSHGQSFLMFRATHLRKAMAELRSGTAQERLQKHFPGHVTRHSGRKAVLLREAGGKVVRHTKKHGHASEVELEAGEREAAPLPLRRSLDDDVRDEQKRRQCNIDSSPACTEIKEKFLEMYAELEEKADDLRRKRFQRRRKMEDAIDLLKAQLEAYDHQIGEEQTALATATAELNSADGEMRLKQREYTALSTEFSESLAGCRLTETSIVCHINDGEAGTCGTNIDRYETEICGIQKIRQELATMSSRTDTITDCQVSEWEPKVECPVSCGGGDQTFERTITWYPHSGSACPPLGKTESCNTQECPIDCEVEDWSEWGACSASCDAGVKSRERGVLVPALHGGEPCGETAEAESCHMEACDQECVLGEWTEWGGCNKGCGGGYQRSTKEIVTPPRGLGTCPETETPERLRWQVCNTQPCSAGLVCNSKMDVVIVLDTSGSVGSEGWRQTKSAAVQLIEALAGGNADIKVAVLVFSGPFYSSQMSQCMGWATPGPSFNVKDDCRMNWVSHMTDDFSTVSTAVTNLPHAGGTTLTSLALQMAKAELSNGRADAQSTVVVVTDGWPLSSYYTSQRAAELREVARLMWVAVTPYAPLSSIETWASEPKASNVIDVRDFTELGESSTVDIIVSDLCPQVSVP